MDAIPKSSDEEIYSKIANSPDFKIYKEVMDCVGKYMAQTNCRHERYEIFPYPERLGELSDLVRKHILREAGDIESFLALESAMDNLPLINGNKPRQPGKFDITIRKMIEWLQSSITEIRPPTTASLKERVVVSVVVWGAYTDKMLNYTFKSLMAEGNLPTLTKNKYVIFYVQTDAKTRDAIEKYDVTWKIKALGINFQYAIIPDEIITSMTDDSSVYWFLGAATSLGMQYAIKAKAAFHHSYPDMIYSNNFFSEILRLSQTHKSILAPGHRSDESLMLPAMLPYISDDVLTVPAADLVAHHLNSIHITAWSCVVNNRPKNWYYPEKHVLIWEGQDLAYFNCPHANALWLSYETIKDIPPRYFMTIDSELDLICKGDDFYIPQECDSLYMCEFSGQARSSVNDLWVKPEGYSTYMWSVITHRDSLKFFVKGMKMPINRKIRPLPEGHILFDEQIAVEKAVLNNAIISNDMYDGVTLGRPRWSDGRIFTV